MTRAFFSIHGYANRNASTNRALKSGSLFNSM